MANECGMIPPGVSGLEIRAVKNGWVVFIGTAHDECLRGTRRSEYVFQDASELADAVKALLTTGQYTKVGFLPYLSNLGTILLTTREELQEGGLSDVSLDDEFFEHPFTHRLLVAASESRDSVVTERANYLAAYQITLDLNLPAEQRAAARFIATGFARALSEAMNRPRYSRP